MQAGLKNAANFMANALLQVVAVFTLLNLFFRFVSPEFDGNWIWINLDFLPQYLEALVLMSFALGVLFANRLNDKFLLATRILAGLIGAFCLYNAWSYYALVNAGLIATSFPVPLSLLLGLSIAAWLLTFRKSETKPTTSWRRRGCLAVAWTGFALLILSLQLFTFGCTDYRRPADAIVVFGAMVFPDGSPSSLLYHRVKTACNLYRRGYAKHLVLSGGIDPRHQTSEPQVMKKVALKLGVPENVIILDEKGVNTISSVRNVAGISQERRWRKVLMVSNDYHLSRIKLLSHRYGLQAYTVPSQDKIALPEKALYVCRELIAWGFYYLSIHRF